MMSLAGRLAIVFVFSANLAFAAENRTLDWSDLVDPLTQTYEDPFRELSGQQIEALRTIVQNRDRLNDPTLSEAQMADSAAKINAALAELAEDNIDADWLIDQRWIVADRRKRAATAVNSQIDGETVSLGGFAIPAPPAEDGTRIVYLVPERGMCSHVPPPNPNQMIRARLSGDWSPSMLHEPVRLTGQLLAQETQHSFRIVDGDVPMQSSFVMEVANVETFKDLQANADATNAWAQKLADDLRASGQLPPKEDEAEK